MVSLSRNACARIAVAAVGLAAAALLSAAWWYASPQEPNIPSQQRPQGPEHDYQPGGEACKPWNIYRLPPDQAAAERDRCAQAYEEHRIEQDNLSQQVRLADLAEGNLRLSIRQARSAFVQTLATILAFIAAGVAAYFAKRAADQTGRAVKAANKTLKHERRSAERELRAYVFVTVTRLKTKQNMIDGRWDMWVRMEYENTGKTPAKNVRVAAKAIQIPESAPVDLAAHGDTQLIGPLGPGDGRMKDVTIEIDPSHLVHGDPWVVHLFGRIDYEDEFAPHRWTTFHAVYANGAKGKTLHTADTGNDYR